MSLWLVTNFDLYFSLGCHRNSIGIWKIWTCWGFASILCRKGRKRIHFRYTLHCLWLDQTWSSNGTGMEIQLIWVCDAVFHSNHEGAHLESRYCPEKTWKTWKGRRKEGESVIKLKYVHSLSRDYSKCPHDWSSSHSDVRTLWNAIVLYDAPNGHGYGYEYASNGDEPILNGNELILNGNGYASNGNEYALNGWFQLWKSLRIVIEMHENSKFWNSSYQKYIMYSSLHIRKFSIHIHFILSRNHRVNW